MFALILAGGKGERLRPLTDSAPKPMVILADRPIIWHQVEWLRQVGVSDVVFLVGYRWRQVQDFFGNGENFGIRAHYSIENTPLGRGGAIRQGFNHVPEEADTVFVLNGDIVTGEDPLSLLESYQQKKEASSAHLATIMVTPMVSPYGLVELNADQEVVDFREKAELPYWINAGIYVFDRSIANLLPERGDHEVETFPGLAGARQLSAFSSRTFWRSVDSFKDLKEAEDYLKYGATADLLLPQRLTESWRK